MRVIDDPMIGKSERFTPDWRSPPGDTIADLLMEKGWTVDEFAGRMEYTPDHARRVLDGTAIITDDAAARLERVVGGSAQFWLEREAQYRVSQIDTGNPADMGEWGAWRAVSRHVTWLVLWGLKIAEEGCIHWLIEYGYDASELIRAVDCSYGPYDIDYLFGEDDE